ncbi:hypothetical protein BJX99DRAFT_228583 [Aspergillus californicus]
MVPSFILCRPWEIDSPNLVCTFSQPSLGTITEPLPVCLSPSRKVLLKRRRRATILDEVKISGRHHGMPL